MSKPAIPLHDPRFVYVPASHTNIAITFARERERLAKAQPNVAKVAPIRKVKP